MTLGSGETGLRAEESATLRIREELCASSCSGDPSGPRSAPELVRLFHAALLGGGPLLDYTDAGME